MSPQSVLWCHHCSGTGLRMVMLGLFEKVKPTIAICGNCEGKGSL